MNVQKTVIGLLLLIVFVGIIYYFLKRTETFESMPMMTYYYLPTCGWCKKFNPVWEKFEEKVKAEKVPVELRKVDGSNSDNSKELEDKGITGFPHVELMVGSKSVSFEGERSVDNLMEFVKKNL